MTIIRYVEREGGHVAEVAPSGGRLEFEPLGFEEYVNFYLGSGDIRFRIRNAKVSIHGPVHNDEMPNGRVNFTLSNVRSSIEYAVLVPGGWLPVNVAQADILLPDSNIAGNLGHFKKSYETPAPHVSGGLEYGARLLSPLLPSLEGNGRSLPSLEQLEARTSEIGDKINRRFPGMCRPLSRQQILAAYGLVEDHAKRWPREHEFLRRMWPLFARMRSKGSESVIPQTLEEALRIQGSVGLPRMAFLNLLALSALFAPKNCKKHHCPGEAVIKPNLVPSPEHFYNVCFDTWILELAMKAHSLFSDSRVAICTNDRGLIGAWALLAPRAFKHSPFVGGEGSLHCSISLRPEMFPRLSSDRFALLLQQLEAGQ